jgi:hypothetical protein
MQLPFSNVQLRYQNPDASFPLILPVQCVCNTPDEVINENIRINSRRAGPWLYARPAHDGVALMCGSGPSLKDDLPRIREMKLAGAKVFALNGAARFLFSEGVWPDYQVILDAQQETASLIGPASEHLFASQVHPECFRRQPDATLWHLQVEGVDDLLPEDHRDRDYTLIGAASSVGTTALVVAFALGFRDLHCFGYDSSHRDGGVSHSFRQPMNDGEPNCVVKFLDREYRTSLTMKMQAERLPYTARLLQREGCAIHIHGTGLLPDIWNAPIEQLSEKEKYERLWSLPDYRIHAPGEDEAEAFLTLANPRIGDSVLDFGCGTGRAALRLHVAGLRVVLVDFAPNCRDPGAAHLPFFELDLTEPMALRADYGFCTDVMEHIPPEATRKALAAMFASAARIYFRIDTKPDLCGALINQELHVALLHHEEWRALLSEYGAVTHERDGGDYSVFYVERTHVA